MEEQVSEWRTPPPVDAPCYENRDNVCRFGISKDITRFGQGNWRRSPLYQVWAHLHGKLPPFNNSHVALGDGVDVTFCTLMDATACFQGIERPIAQENNGESVLVYVLKIAGTLIYQPRMTAPIQGFPVPEKTLLTVVVRLKDSLLSIDKSLDGIVTRLEPVRCDPNNGDLPFEYETRYRKRCW
jgi:hypothetical protein